MSVALIVFNIFDPNNQKACRDQIEASEHFKINDSSYLIKTSQSLDILRRELSEYFDKTDVLVISRLRDLNWISYHVGKKNRDWIEENA